MASCELHSVKRLSRDSRAVLPTGSCTPLGPDVAEGAARWCNHTMFRKCLPDVRG